MTRLLIGTLIVNLLLVVPLWAQYLSLSAGWLAAEALLIAPLLALPPHRWASALRFILVVAMLVTLLLGLSNAATYHVLGRPLNLYLDVPLLASVYSLLAGTLGRILAALVCTLVLLLVVAALTGLQRLAFQLQGTAGTAPAAGVAALLMVAGGTALAGQLTGSQPLPGLKSPLVDTLGFQARQITRTLHEQRAFEQAVSQMQSQPQALSALEGRDVVLLFVESYGADVLDRPPWRQWLAPRLSAMEQRLSQAGLGMASGLLSAPIRGGQSWLSHASVLSGLTVDNQLRYRLLLASDRPTLVDDFRATGHATVAIMPAITMAWPEGEAYGFDAIHDAERLGYSGPRLNWVTMPDQYTLHRFQRAVRERQAKPVFAKIALISSHAPWTPILPVLDDWQRIGDGRVFERWADAGPAPELLWRDLSRVREHHARALDYTLKVITHWARRSLDRNDLLIVIGDHPAAPMISGREAGHAVPVHVVSGDTRLLSPFLKRGFTPGARVSMLDTRQPPSMASFRGWLHEGFGNTDNRP